MTDLDRAALADALTDAAEALQRLQAALLDAGAELTAAQPELYEWPEDDADNACPECGGLGYFQGHADNTDIDICLDCRGTGTR